MYQSGFHQKTGFTPDGSCQWGWTGLREQTMHVRHSAISNNGRLLPDFPRLTGTKREHYWSPVRIGTMRRVHLVRALVMTGQSRCQRPGAKVGKE